MNNSKKQQFEELTKMIRVSTILNEAREELVRLQRTISNYEFQYKESIGTCITNLDEVIEIIKMKALNHNAWNQFDEWE